MEESTINQSKKETSKNWLQRLKDESWEAELLVSAIAIFGTFQLFGIIDWSANFFIDTLKPNQYIIGYFITTFGLLAISILVSMFVIHFSLRAYWIGLVGLNSVFPDYSIEDSAYSKIYTERLLSILPKLKDSIKKVDELCSVIFSVAFTFLLMYSYIAIFASLYLLLFNLLSNYIESYVLLIPLFIIGIIYLFQTLFSIFANLKSFRNNKKIQIWYFKTVKLGSLMTFGPIYKSILQVSMIFGSNFKKKKYLVYLIFVFLFAGICVFGFQVSKTNVLSLTNQSTNSDSTRMYSNYYETRNKTNTFLLSPEIESDKVQENVVKIFIPIYNNEKAMVKEICNDFVEDKNKSKEENRQTRWSNNLNCYTTYNSVYLNGNKVTVEFLKYEHHRTGQSGILGYLDASKIKSGMHTIVVKKNFTDDENNKEWSIPFYKTPN